MSMKRTVRTAAATALAACLSGCIIPIPIGTTTTTTGATGIPAAFGWIALLFAAICLWQLLAGLKKMRIARDNPQDPRAPLFAKMGKLQAILGGVLLVANILLNLPALRMLAG